jgi:hypothetical protein
MINQWTIHHQFVCVCFDWCTTDGRSLKCLSIVCPISSSCWNLFFSSSSSSSVDSSCKPAAGAGAAAAGAAARKSQVDDTPNVVFLSPFLLAVVQNGHAELADHKNRRLFKRPKGKIIIKEEEEVGCLFVCLCVYKVLKTLKKREKKKKFCISRYSGEEAYTNRLVAST